MIRKIHLISNKREKSDKTAEIYFERLSAAGFECSCDFSGDCDMVLTFGGDGVFLENIHKLNFPDMIFAGVNTGHQGFFQELETDGCEELITMLKNDDFLIQEYTPLKAIVSLFGQNEEYCGINEIMLKMDRSKAIRMKICIDDEFLENYSGDGVLVSTSAGCTSYNYSLRGSIVDPRLQLLQLTPIAPMNTAAYRSFTSSLILPQQSRISIVPDDRENVGYILMSDGLEYQFDKFEKLEIMYSDKRVKLLRSSKYKFWNTVNKKFL